MSEAAVTLSARQRDLLYDRILVHLSGIDDLWNAAMNDQFDVAERLGREFSDELRLVVDDLGWGERSSDEPLELTTPPDVVRRVIERIAAIVEAEDVAEEEERVALRDAEEERRRLRETCSQVLRDLTSPA